MVQQKFSQWVVQAQEGHFIYPVFTQTVVRQLQGVQTRSQVAEHIARDTLNLVVMQDELPQTNRQERGNVNQLIVGKVQILQFSVDKDIFEDCLR